MVSNTPKACELCGSGGPGEIIAPVFAGTFPD
jgi:hypothetical protein